MTSDYLKYRGKCKEFVDAAVKADPSLTAIRGFYHCPIDGKQEHWWTKKEDGSIFDPTAKQFKSSGCGEYEEFDGTLECDSCDATCDAEEMIHESRYHFCSGECYGRFVGVKIN